MYCSYGELITLNKQFQTSFEQNGLQNGHTSMTQNTKNALHEGHLNFTKLSFMHKYMPTQIHQIVVVMHCKLINIIHDNFKYFTSTTISNYIMKINAPCIRSVNLTTVGI